MNDKLVFGDVGELVTYMFDKVNVDDPVTVVADKDLTIDVLAELLTYKDVALELADIDTFEYDREYFVSLLYDEEESDSWRVSVEKAYNYDREEYLGMYGYLLFHEDINSKILVDIQNNENVEMSGHDWFIIGDDDSFETDEEEEDPETDKETADTAVSHGPKAELSKDKTIYRVNNKEVDKATFDKALNKFRAYEDAYWDGAIRMLSDYHTEWINAWLRSFSW